MNRVVLKYTQQFQDIRDDKFSIKIPISGELLNVVNQYEQLAIYVECNEGGEGDTSTVQLNFMAVKTGFTKFRHYLQPRYINTVLFDSGDYVLHIYQI